MKCKDCELPIIQDIDKYEIDKYEWLIINGCTSSEDRAWLAKYIRSDEYNILYN